MGSETLQGGSKKAFQHLQSNQKNHRREIQSAHGRECATDRPQKRSGKAVDKLDNRAVIWELEPREYDRDENDQRVEIDNIGQNHTFRSFIRNFQFGLLAANKVAPLSPERHEFRAGSQAWADRTTAFGVLGTGCADPIVD